LAADGFEVATTIAAVRDSAPAASVCFISASSASVARPSSRYQIDDHSRCAVRRNSSALSPAGRLQLLPSPPPSLRDRALWDAEGYRPGGRRHVLKPTSEGAELSDVRGFRRLAYEAELTGYVPGLGAAERLPNVDEVL